jgi:hypothetical protein
MAGEHRGRLCLCANAAMRRRRLGTSFLKWKLPFRKQKKIFPLLFFKKKLKFPWLQLIREGERGGCKLEVERKAFCSSPPASK